MLTRIFLSRKTRENIPTRAARWRMAPSRCPSKRAIMKSQWQLRTTSSDGASSCACLIRKGFIWQQSDKPDGWQTMDEESSGPRCCCGSGMDDSRLSVCLTGPLFRHGQASRSALISYAVVVLGSGHTSHPLGGPEDPHFPQATCPTSSRAFASQLAGDVCVRLSFGGSSRRLRDV